MKYNILRRLRQHGFKVAGRAGDRHRRGRAGLQARRNFSFQRPGRSGRAGLRGAAPCPIWSRAASPIFGICLGHQILGQAFGGKTFKLKFGHRGGNQPVKDLATGKVEITSQNHGFAVDPTSLPAEVAVDRINLNDQTVEGMRHKNKPIFCVQYHPEASPGPHDSTPLFAEFRELIEKS